MTHTLLTLANGIEILGEFVSQDENSIRLFMPMAISSKLDEQSGIPYYVLQPWSIYSRLSDFNKKFVISLTNTPVQPIINTWFQIVAQDQAQQQAYRDGNDISSSAEITEGADEGLDDEVEMSLPQPRLKPTIH